MMQESATRWEMDFPWALMTIIIPYVVLHVRAGRIRVRIVEPLLTGAVHELIIFKNDKTMTTEYKH